MAARFRKYVARPGRDVKTSYEEQDEKNIALENACEAHSHDASSVRKQPGHGSFRPARRHHPLRQDRKTSAQVKAVSPEEQYSLQKSGNMSASFEGVAATWDNCAGHDGVRHPAKEASWQRRPDYGRNVAASAARKKAQAAPSDVQDTEIRGGKSAHGHAAEKRVPSPAPVRAAGRADRQENCQYDKRRPGSGQDGQHPLAHVGGQWGAMARQRREQAARRLSAEAEGRCAEVGAETRVSEDTPPLPSVSRNWRSGGREEVAAWQRGTVFSATGKEDSAGGQRLNKAIAEAGYCSRRRADILVFTGHVTVNGEREVRPSRRVCPEDSIAVDGKPIKTGTPTKHYLLLHKPVQVVCTAFDPQGRPTVLSCLPSDYADIRLFPVGRLDYFSEGLLLLTNDGALSQRLIHPRYHLPKTYDVLVREVVREKALQVMRSGMTLAEGEHLLPVDVTARATSSGKTLLRMILRQGVNRQIRRMCRDLGLTILRLRRISLGPLQLGDLPAGQCRELTVEELEKLRKAAGLL